MSERLTHGSLFSGIGGPEIAAEMMGWKNVFHCEINPFGRKILDYWFPNSKSYEDITKTDFTEWRGKINVLTGGFPCQPFSCAGQRKGADDDRYLWPEMLRAIREIQPDWVVGENVAGILTMVQPGSETPLGSEETLFGEDNRKRTLHRQEYVVETVCNDLEREGYSVQPVVIPACAVGAPHRRDRVFFIARRIQDNNNNIGSGYTCRFGRFSVSESMEMEDKQFRVCLQNNQSERRWKEMEDYLDAQIDLLSEGKRGSGPYQQMQNGQQKAKSSDIISLGESSQSEERVRSKETEGTEQMACDNLCEQEKDSPRIFRYKRGGDECKVECGEKIVAHRADAGSEGMQREWENNILSGGTAPDTDSHRWRDGKNQQVTIAERKGTADIGTFREDGASSYSQCPGSGQVQQEIQSEQSNGHSFDSNGGEWDATNSNSEKLQEWLKTRRRSDEAENRARMDNGIERFGSLRYAPYSSSEGLSTLRFPTSIEKEKRENEDGCSVQPPGNVRRASFAERWKNFPTQSPVCSRDDGISTRLDGIAFSKWRQESIKAYGNAILPQVIYEIFRAINIVENGRMENY